MNRISVNYPDNFIEGQAFVAFKIHYDVTKKPGWETAEQHWKRHTQARELWCMVVMGILSGAETFVRGSVAHIGQPVGVPPAGNAAKALLARIGQPAGPMSPMPGRTGRFNADKPNISLPPKRGLHPDSPLLKTDYAEVEKRVIANLTPEERAKMMYGMSDSHREQAERSIQPGLAIDRACIDCEEPAPISPFLDAMPAEVQSDDPEEVNRDEVLDEALRQHQEGEDE